ncbi:MAG TPA: transglycosylase SLT domain-containing protein, partial [Candidatus Binataceae bacterium]|nr:transglycosylase SLT domain-containing protein [Candidatus Binataceae bacterium]
LKHISQSANQFAMRTLHWTLMLLGITVVAALAAQGTPPAHMEDTANSVSGSGLAQLPPLKRNEVGSIDPDLAFVQGYRAYKRHDLVAAIERMRLASHTEHLGDYALFYLASAERDHGENAAAAADFRRVTVSYPQSIWSDQAELEYARLELKLGHPQYALIASAAVVDRTRNATIEQNARLTEAYAALAMNSWRDAYNQAQLIRQKFPTGPADPAARKLAHAILRGHPEAISASPLEHHRTEAALLLREGQGTAALREIRAAMALSPPLPIQIELTWFSAEAWRGQPEKMKPELLRYLELAPRGPEAPRALNGLAHLSWHQNDTTTARLYFRRLVQEFPHSQLAPGVMFEIGRTYEEDGNLRSARLAYQELLSRYPSADVIDDARFRAAFMVFQLGQYKQAADEFKRSRALAETASNRDMMDYWQARALEAAGKKLEAHALFETLALSTASNYYPALAAMRINETSAVLPASFAGDLIPGAVPNASGAIEFHLSRVAALRDLGLGELEAPELRAVEGHLDGNQGLRKFVLAELQGSGAWYDAIQMATRMAARGELASATAERIRYPRGFWNLIAPASGRYQLDPYLVAALIRQESLYNPQACSISDARGLMQLLPSTADRYAVAAGLFASPLDLYDPNISIQLGTAYLHQLMGMFDGNIFKVVAAYNAGEHAVTQWNARYPGDDDQWVENIAFRETRDYVKKVIGGRREYRMLYGSRSVVSTSIPTQ